MVRIRRSASAEGNTNRVRCACTGGGRSRPYRSVQVDGENQHANENLASALLDPEDDITREVQSEEEGIQ